MNLKKINKIWSKGGRAAFGPANDYNRTQTDYLKNLRIFSRICTFVVGGKSAYEYPRSF